MENSIPEQLFDYVANRVDISKNPWLLYKYCQIDSADQIFRDDPSLLEHEEFADRIVQSSNWIEFQNLIIQHLDSQLSELCTALHRKSNKTHDLLGPFSLTDIDRLISSSDNPDDSYDAFCRFLELRLWLSYRMDFGFAGSIPATGRFRFSRRLQQVTSRDRLRLLASLVMHDSETAQEFGSAWVMNSLEEVSDKWWDLSERGEIGWPELPSFLLDRDQHFPGETGNFILRNLRPEKKAKNLYLALVSLGQTEDGKIKWPLERWDRQQLAYVIDKLIGPFNPVIAALANPWAQAENWFAFLSPDGEQVDMKPKSLSEFATRVRDNPQKVNAEIRMWFE